MKRSYEKKSYSLECVTERGKKSKLIVFNDNFNTFEHVIHTLIRVCKHNPEQAEQCTWIIHHKGQCVVKEGLPNNLQLMCGLVREAGIAARIA